jgi:hypothetical protein
MSTTVANGGGAAPVARVSNSGRPGQPRTVIPAQTGSWVFGKTIGAGSMGKVKLTQRVEDGEQELLTAD